MDIGDVLVPELGEKKKKKASGKDVDSLFAALDLGEGSEEAQREMASSSSPAVPQGRRRLGMTKSAGGRVLCRHTWIEHGCEDECIGNRFLPCRRQEG